MLLPAVSFAQEMSKEEMDAEKKFREGIDTIIEKYESDLKLESWQVFYLDSILTHDFQALRDEIKSMGKAGVENPDLYIEVQDKWQEQIYNSLSKVFDEEQWARYLKSGAGKEKKARDKRKAKKEGTK